MALPLRNSLEYHVLKQFSYTCLILAQRSFAFSMVDGLAA